MGQQLGEDNVTLTRGKDLKRHGRLPSEPSP